VGDGLGCVVVAGEGVAAGVGVMLGGGEGRGDRPRLDGAAVAFAAAGGCALVERTGWLQPQTRRSVIPIPAARV
jgi:hypothetical protein